jgi:dihydroorotate dehydrogenase (fumarate)
MVDLSTTYMELNLRNPTVVGSSSLTKSVEGIKQCADAGAGAIVMKSLFEEPADPEIDGEKAAYRSEEQPMLGSKNGHTDGRLNVEEYLRNINEAKQEVSLPIIASLSCVSMEGWKKYAKMVWNAGADALELNISVVPYLSMVFSRAIEDLYLVIFEEVRNVVSIPVSLKLNPYFASMMRLAYDLGGSGASALVLFDRFYQIDIDIENLKLKGGSPFSSSEEMSNGLRWMALLHGKVNCDLAASTGIYEAEDVIKQLLAGAKVVQLCSTLYKNGLEKIASILSSLESWMEKHGFHSLEDFRGILSQEKCKDFTFFERLQYGGNL